MIYFVQDLPCGAIKIGYTACPDKRLSTLRSSYPNSKFAVLLIMKGSPEMERYLHKKFRNILISGEWFKPEQELLEFISKQTSDDTKQDKPRFNFPSAAEKSLKEIGLQLKTARKRRGWTIAELAGKMSTSAPTVISMEQGNPKIGSGILFSAMWILGLEEMMKTISQPDDKIGHALMDSRLPKRIRHKKPSNDF